MARGYVPRADDSSISVRVQREQVYTTRHGPWGAGVNTRTRDEKLQYNEFRDAVNVDVLQDGGIRRRAGRTAIDTSAGAHSLWTFDNANMLGVIGQTLTHFQVTPSSITTHPVRTGCLPDKYFSYTYVGNQVYYTNGQLTGVYDMVTRVHKSWGLPVPVPPLLSATSSGGLFKGRYQVVCTYVGTDGEESGASIHDVVEVVEGGGILVTLPTAIPPNVAAMNVYMTKNNGTAFFHARKVAIGTSAVGLGAGTLDRPLDTQFLHAPPAGTGLATLNGRHYVVVGSRLYYTEAMRYGAIKQSNFIPFEADIAIVVAVDEGLFVGGRPGTRTWFLQGNDPEGFQIREVLSYGAVQGTAIIDPMTNEAIWFTEHGLVVGGKQGEVKAVNEDRMAFSIHGRGSLGYFERDGDRRYVALVQEGVPNPLVHSDFTAAKKLRRVLSSDR